MDTKNFILHFAFIALSVAVINGCHDSTPLDPLASGSNDHSIIQIHPAMVRDPVVVIPTAPIQERTVDMVDLPAGIGKESIFSDSKLVTVANGGVLSCSGRYYNMSGRWVSRAVSFTVPPNAVKHDVQITMILDTVHLAVIFEPSGLFFDQPAVLSFQADGLDLNAAASPLELYFIDDNTNVAVPVEQKIMTTDVLKGTVDLQAAEIHHFSKYGFGR